MGVKSLWNLLAPVGRPVMLETLEGKALAIDSSIWIYQFQATMRDKDGRALANAHVLGFLRRICKLLFYGIKPVFVFDGGAPVLKRATINERKRRKTSASENHAKVAEKLLAAQMRREALNRAVEHQPGKSSKGKGKATTIDDDTVYLEDIDPSMPKTPARKAKRKDPSSTPSKKARFYDHDPYRLPDVDLEDAIAQATRSALPDPRLATEDELRAFIEEMKPEDFDVTSSAFRELPTEVQYEIIGDLRLKSRQTSYKRLQNMLRKAPTPLDFSREQIRHLKERNALTQQLLTTTDSIGKAHISIPVRIASERNKQYLLIKNEGDIGGWVLGIRDEGTAAKPIQVDEDSDDESVSDEEMEEVDIPRAAAPDPDLREYQRKMALSALAKRYSPKNLTPLTTKPSQRKPNSVPLFDPDPDSDDDFSAPPKNIESDDDVELAVAIQESLDQEANSSRTTIPPTPSTGPSHMLSFASSSKSGTAISNANAGPSTEVARGLSEFGSPDRLILSRPSLRSSPDPIHSDSAVMEIPVQVETTVISGSVPDHKENSDSDDMEEVITVEHIPPRSRTADSGSPASGGDAVGVASSRFPLRDGALQTTLSDRHLESSMILPVVSPYKPQSVENKHLEAFEPLVDSQTDSEPIMDSDVDRHSQPSSPVTGPYSASARQRQPYTTENWDAAQEMDPEAEEGEFVRFISQVKGRNFDDVRREIDDEITTLNQQKKVAMRDSEDITQQMVSQIMIMLRLFGIPYITAPMEAEAQCATLVSLGLVDGIITDDSDVFLFGGLRVFKNMFNQSKTVECFFLNDLTRDLGLDRGTLIRLAYLLGSDYVDGVPGIGPVVAMELLREFPGDDGLHGFRKWWSMVQTGKDKSEDSDSKFRKSFKKKFKDLYLSDEWPNPAVRDAYLHPAVDGSDEPFKWGLPDLDALRHFLGEELGWSQTKVDELLLPIIQKMGKRNQKGAMNKQGNLNEFFDTTVGIQAPRKRQLYASKRLQKVVSDFQAGRSEGRSGSRPQNPGEDGRSEPDTDTEEYSAKKKGPSGKRKRKATQRVSSPSTRAKTSKSGGRVRKTEKPPHDASSDSGEYENQGTAITEPLGVRLRPRPRPAYELNSVTIDQSPSVT